MSVLQQVAQAFLPVPNEKRTDKTVCPTQKLCFIRYLAAVALARAVKRDL